MESYKTFWDILDVWGYFGTFGDIWGHWADICRHQEHESPIRDKKLTKSWKEEEKKKAHTKTAPVYAVKNSLKADLYITEYTYLKLKYYQILLNEQLAFNLFVK